MAILPVYSYLPFQTNLLPKHFLPLPTTHAILQLFSVPTSLPGNHMAPELPLGPKGEHPQ